jgi:hypothetical protein
MDSFWAFLAVFSEIQFSTSVPRISRRQKKNERKQETKKSQERLIKKFE